MADMTRWYTWFDNHAQPSTWRGLNPDPPKAYYGPDLTAEINHQIPAATVTTVGALCRVFTGVSLHGLPG